MFPSRSLAELVRAMKLKSGGEEGSKEDNPTQHQLPSILETDPAVAQAVRSSEPFYPQPMMPQVKLRLCQSVEFVHYNVLLIICLRI